MTHNNYFGATPNWNDFYVYRILVLQGGFISLSFFSLHLCWDEARNGMPVQIWVRSNPWRQAKFPRGQPISWNRILRPRNEHILSLSFLRRVESFLNSFIKGFNVIEARQNKRHRHRSVWKMRLNNWIYTSGPQHHDFLKLIYKFCVFYMSPSMSHDDSTHSKNDNSIFQSVTSAPPKAKCAFPNETFYPYRTKPDLSWTKMNYKNMFEAAALKADDRPLSLFPFLFHRVVFSLFKSGRNSIKHKISTYKYRAISAE